MNHDSYPKLGESQLQLLRSGIAIPAHPLALDSDRRLDEARQKALSRYYLSAGAGGLAVGVHTTQFEIREHGLYEEVLRLAAAVAQEKTAAPRSPLLVAGICGFAEQAINEARVARRLNYDMGLLSLSAFGNAAESEILEHCDAVAREIPLFGFYLQPSVGGRLLSYHFWRQFAEIPNAMAIKLAPFNRYQTLDAVRAVAESTRWKDISLYTGNDDSIVVDLLSTFRFEVEGETRFVGFSGGLLGHWACWTKSSVAVLEKCKTIRDTSNSGLCDLLILANQVTDMNAAIFDAANAYQGCIAGIHEVLRRQGLLEGIWCLDEAEQLSPGQADEISRVCRAYPHLVDDGFVQKNLSQWL